MIPCLAMWSCVALPWMLIALLLVVFGAFIRYGPSDRPSTDPDRKDAETMAFIAMLVGILMIVAAILAHYL